MVPSLFLIRLLRTSKPKSVDVESLYGITRQRVHSSLGKSPEDFTRVMLDMADGARFTTADEKHRGISVSNDAVRFPWTHEWISSLRTGRKLAPGSERPSVYSC